jgi:hypothetical protein
MIDFAENHVEFFLEFRPVLFPLNGYNDPFCRGIVPEQYIVDGFVEQFSGILVT